MMCCVDDDDDDDDDASPQTHTSLITSLTLRRVLKHNMKHSKP